VRRGFSGCGCAVTERPLVRDRGPVRVLDPSHRTRTSISITSRRGNSERRIRGPRINRDWCSRCVRVPVLVFNDKLDCVISGFAKQVRRRLSSFSRPISEVPGVCQRLSIGIGRTTCVKRERRVCVSGCLVCGEQGRWRTRFYSDRDRGCVCIPVLVRRGNCDSEGINSTEQVRDCVTSPGFCCTVTECPFVRN